MDLPDVCSPCSGAVRRRIAVPAGRVWRHPRPDSLAGRTDVEAGASRGDPARPWTTDERSASRGRAPVCRTGELALGTDRPPELHGGPRPSRAFAFTSSSRRRIGPATSRGSRSDAAASRTSASSNAARSGSRACRERWWTQQPCHRRSQASRLVIEAVQRRLVRLDDVATGSTCGGRTARCVSGRPWRRRRQGPGRSRGRPGPSLSQSSHSARGVAEPGAPRPGRRTADDPGPLVRRRRDGRHGPQPEVPRGTARLGEHGRTDSDLSASPGSRSSGWHLEPSRATRPECSTHRGRLRQRSPLRPTRGRVATPRVVSAAGALFSVARHSAVTVGS